MPNNYHLEGIGSLWRQFFKDRPQLEQFYEGASGSIEDAYLKFVAIVQTTGLAGVPVYDRENWVAITINKQDSVIKDGKLIFPMPAKLARPLRAESVRILTPSISAHQHILSKTKDFSIEGEFIVFNSDPFQDFASFADEDNLTLWSPDNLVASHHIQRGYGFFFLPLLAASQSYKRMLEGLFWAFTHGPKDIGRSIEVGLNASLMLPMAGEKESVVASSAGVIVTDKAEYRVPLDTAIQVKLGEVLAPFQPLVGAIAVTDYLKTPGWWNGVVNEFPYFPTVLGKVKASGANEIFEKYLKYNTFLVDADIGIFSKSRIAPSISDMRRFVHTLGRLKPSHTFAVLKMPSVPVKRYIVSMSENNKVSPVFRGTADMTHGRYITHYMAERHRMNEGLPMAHMLAHIKQNKMDDGLFMCSGRSLKTRIELGGSAIVPCVMGGYGITYFTDPDTGEWREKNRPVSFPVRRGKTLAELRLEQVSRPPEPPAPPEPSLGKKLRDIAAVTGITRDVPVIPLSNPLRDIFGTAKSIISPLKGVSINLVLPAQRWLPPDLFKVDIFPLAAPSAMHISLAKEGISLLSKISSLGNPFISHKVSSLDKGSVLGNARDASSFVNPLSKLDIGGLAKTVAIGSPVVRPSALLIYPHTDRIQAEVVIPVGPIKILALSTSRAGANTIPSVLGSAQTGESPRIGIVSRLLSVASPNETLSAVDGYNSSFEVSNTDNFNGPYLWRISSQRLNIENITSSVVDREVLSHGERIKITPIDTLLPGAISARELIMVRPRVLYSVEGPVRIEKTAFAVQVLVKSIDIAKVKDFPVKDLAVYKAAAVNVPIGYAPCVTLPRRETENVASNLKGFLRSVSSNVNIGEVGKVMSLARAFVIGTDDIIGSENSAIMDIRAVYSNRVELAHQYEDVLEPIESLDRSILHTTSIRTSARFPVIERFRWSPLPVIEKELVVKVKDSAGIRYPQPVVSENLPFLDALHSLVVARHTSFLFIDTGYGTISMANGFPLVTRHVTEWLRSTLPSFESAGVELPANRTIVNAPVDDGDRNLVVGGEVAQFDIRDVRWWKMLSSGLFGEKIDYQYIEKGSVILRARRVREFDLSFAPYRLEDEVNLGQGAILFPESLKMGLVVA